MGDQNPYDVLGVPRDADVASIRSAYRRAAKRAHPDAGGSTEEFTAVSRAFGVLVSAERRANFDRTGKVDDDGPNNEQIEIHNMVLQAVLFAVGQGDARFTDIIRTARDHCDGKIYEVDTEIAKHKAACADTVGRYETVLKRTKRKKTDGPDMLVDMLHGAIAQTQRTLEANLAQLEPQLRKIKAAREILADYQYAVDRREAQQQGWVGLGDLMRTQTGGTFFTR